MLIGLSDIIVKKIASYAKEDDQVLSSEDKSVLRHDAPGFLRRVQMNLKFDKDPFDGLDETQRRILLAYVIFLRQNIATGPGDRPNEEDASMIMHAKVYKDNKKTLDEDLQKQLEKIGIKFPEEDEKGDKK